MKLNEPQVLALIPLNVDDVLFSADYRSGMQADIKNRVFSSFIR